MVVLRPALLLALPALAVEPSEMLKDPALEARAREIGRALRCVVCQNQAIDDSNAEVAHDMRRAVRERLTAGDSDDAVFAFMVARYGDYVLLKPPFKIGHAGCCGSAARWSCCSPAAPCCSPPASAAPRAARAADRGGARRVDSLHGRAPPPRRRHGLARRRRSESRGRSR